ncbi:hypothetical protein SDC9_05808 [bioreactor metagenome]|uniref:GGDEF domain-containing protein n=1 Tax=bioreactor metagenome TaxID=1076179 RepID=A0A644SZX8_9ZZZZ|nr:sensor domain-containing diguanylate cyclase [Desulfovibrio desulfuricans]MEA4990049.1 sensor domain-containing diguanylate cyclase [Desulfovibrio desulfuricans]
MQKNTRKSFCWGVDPDLVYRNVDTAKERLLELPVGSLTGKFLVHCMHPDDAAMLRRALASAEPRALTGCTVRYVCPKGTHTVTSLSIKPLRSACGTLLGFEGEEHSIGSVDMHGDFAPIFEEVFAHDFMALCIVNRDGQLLAVNAQYAIIANKPANALVRAHILEAGVPSVEDVDRAFSFLPSGKSISEQEIIWDGKDYVMAMYGLPDACGEIRSICVSLRDISLRKGLERRLEAANRQLEEMNLKDYLTGVFNRRHFDEALQREVARLAREGGEMCIGMVDVDKFKLYNDAYGHLAGDDCLARAAKAMSAALFRPGDELFRYGGEEFAIIMPQTGKKSATMVAERVREAISALHIPHCQSALGHVTISIGVAALDAASALSGHTACEELIRVADKALYAAKNSGRNKVASAACSIAESD